MFVKRGSTLLFLFFVAMSSCSRPPEPAPPRTAMGSALEERTSWYGLYLSGRKVGWTRTDLKRLGESGDYRLGTESYMKFNTGGIVQESEMELSIDFDRALVAKAFRFSMASPAMTMDVDGIVTGGKLKTTMTTPNGSRAEETEIPEGVDLFGLAEFRRAVEGYKVGDVIEGKAYEPQFLGMIDYRIEVYDSEIVGTGAAADTVFRVRSRLGPIEQTSIVASNGDLIQSMGPMGIELKRESKVVAMDLGSSANLTDLYLELSIPVDTEIVNASSARRAVMKVTGVDEASLAGGGAQSAEALADGAFRVIVDINDIPREKISPEVLEASLESSSFVQSEDSRVVARAREILAGAKDPAEKVERIYRWVYDNVKKAPTFTIPSTVDVLASMTGDCNEHAALFAGLARASGIPVRIAAGVVYFRGRLAYHAWNEVVLGDRWVPIDATLNENPAGALRIRFAVGDLDEQVKIAAFAGKVGVRILEVDR